MFPDWTVYLIAAAYAAAIVFVWALCRTSARADEQAAREQAKAQHPAGKRRHLRPVPDPSE